METKAFLLKSASYGCWSIEEHRSDSWALEKSRADAFEAGSPLVAVRLTKARLTDEERIPTGRPGMFQFAHGSTAPVVLFVTPDGKRELRARVTKAATAGRIPARSPELLDSGALDIGIVKSVMGVSDYDPDDDAEMTDEASAILSKAYEANANDLKKAGAPYADLRAAAAELDALVEKLGG
jgi:hypothetical protein